MRLFLIPISTRRALIYSRPLNKDLPKELSITDRITNKAAETWAKWEEIDKGWKKRLVTWGNSVQQRIPFEEWGLKSIPSLKAQRRINESDADRKVNVFFPGNAIRKEKLYSILQTLAKERQDLHRKRMWWSFIVAPVTAPIALIPVYVFLAHITTVLYKCSNLELLGTKQDTQYSLLLPRVPRVVSLARLV